MVTTDLTLNVYTCLDILPLLLYNDQKKINLMMPLVMMPILYSSVISQCHMLTMSTMITDPCHISRIQVCYLRRLLTHVGHFDLQVTVTA